MYLFYLRITYYILKVKTIYKSHIQRVGFNLQTKGLFTIQKKQTEFLFAAKRTIFYTKIKLSSYKTTNKMLTKQNNI